MEIQTSSLRELTIWCYYKSLGDIIVALELFFKGKFKEDLIHTAPNKKRQENRGNGGHPSSIEIVVCPNSIYGKNKHLVKFSFLYRSHFEYFLAECLNANSTVLIG